MALSLGTRVVRNSACGMTRPALLVTVEQQHHMCHPVKLNHGGFRMLEAVRSLLG